MRSLFYGDTVSWLGSCGLLLLRVVVGAAFLFHGWSKIQDPLGWMGPDASVPASLQALASLAEFGGGAALIVGLLGRLAALGIACVMVTAITTVHLPAGHPFVSTTGGPSHELAVVYFACVVVLVLLGPGRFSLDARFFGKARTKPPEAGA